MGFYWISHDRIQVRLASSGVHRCCCRGRGLTHSCPSLPQALLYGVQLVVACRLRSRGI